MRGLLLSLCLLFCVVANSQTINSFGVAYFNVDKLYDTIPSRFYDDRAYTPAGRMGWNSDRYQRKVVQVAAVVDSMALPVVALYGVENEQVVRDIVEACSEDYSYIHRTSNSYDGLDFALLYFADCFYVDQVTEQRGALCVEGEANEQPLAIIAAHRSTSLGVLMEERKLPGDSNIIILGDAGKLNFKKYGLRDASEYISRAGRGNRIHQGVWYLQDRVLTNIVTPAMCDVYIKSWLLDRNGVPQPTFEGAKYCAGGSSFLPIYIYFKK